jgi:hypothetical protein
MLAMALHPSVCIELAIPHILLSRLGFHDRQFDDYLALCLGANASRGHERPPYAALEKRWILDMWNGDGARSDWHVDLTQSVLKWPIDLLGGIKEDAYALTHLVIYQSDFGFNAKPLPRPTSAILAEARSFLARCLDEEDYDLAAETLMIWPLVGAPWCASSAFAFRVLLHVEDQAGVLPSVRTNIDRLNRLEGDDKKRYAFATAYHTALVMGLLCAVSLRKGLPSPNQTEERPIPPRLEDDLVPFVKADHGHWQPVFWSAPAAERLALTPLLLDIALVQSVRERDYDAANRLLGISSAHGLDPSPLMIQASEMLERLAAFSELSGSA